eukprot:16290522-Heterocapsa_arctica.AAC.1
MGSSWLGRAGLGQRLRVRAVPSCPPSQPLYGICSDRRSSWPSGAHRAFIFTLTALAQCLPLWALHPCSHT